MATDGWYPLALEDFASDDGGAFINPVTVGVLHKTISSPGGYRPNGRDYFGHQSYPHFTVDVQRGVFKCWQHISIRRAAKALRNLPGGVQTNREGVIQIEIVGWATDDPSMDPALVDGLSALMRWIESQTYIPPTTDVEWREYPPSGATLGREPWRMSFDEWVRYAGWCAHQHTPENVHGDVGAIDINLLLPQRTPGPLTPDLQLQEDTLLKILYTPKQPTVLWDDGVMVALEPGEVDVLKRRGVPVEYPSAADFPILQKISARIQASRGAPS